MDLYIVTGTTKGLGAALARQIAADGTSELIALARTGAAAAGRSTTIAVDVADLAALDRACDRLDAAIAGKAYAKAVLINNAGVVGPVGPLEAVDPEELARNLAVNLTAPMLLMRRFLRATAHVPLRRIVNISSGAARRPIFGWSAYCAAKAGLDMASRAVALETATRGQAVEVVSLAPGVIDTPMQGTVRAATAEQFVDVERFRAMKAEGVLRPAEDVAADILRLERAGKLKGEVLRDLREIA